MNEQQDDLLAIDAAAPREVSELDGYQRREKIYTRGIEGRFQRLRLYTGWPLLLGYFLLPWLMLQGQQAVLFDLPARRFHILTLTFWPQDLVLLGFMLIIAAFALFTVTTLFGRVWCGYTCPQTVWTAIFMYIEQLFEGSRNQRIKLDAQAMSVDKFRRKFLKHAGWFSVAFITGLTFVGYFTPIRELVGQLAAGQPDSWAITFIGLFTLLTYLNAGYMREKVCTQMCPYARFQSAMFDRNTLIVSYDASRGEPRGSRKRTASRPSGLGDCIDCRLCVQVCPTGIDIRQGLQYECISCALCIDACDSIMDKMGYAKGLVSYTSENALEASKTKLIRPRTLGYSAALLAMLVAFSVQLITLAPLHLAVERDRDQLYLPAPGGRVDNLYALRITNRDTNQQRFRIGFRGLADAELIGQQVISIPGGETHEASLRIRANPLLLSAHSTGVFFNVQRVDQPDIEADIESRFLKPLL